MKPVFEVVEHTDGFGWALLDDDRAVARSSERFETAREAEDAAMEFARGVRDAKIMRVIDGGAR